MKLNLICKLNCFKLFHTIKRFLHNDVTFDILLPLIQQPLVHHDFRTMVTKLRSLQQKTLGMKVLISKSPEYKPTAIILEIARFRLYKLVQTGSLEETKKRNIQK